MAGQVTQPERVTSADTLVVQTLTRQQLLLVLVLRLLLLLLLLRLLLHPRGC